MTRTLLPACLGALFIAGDGHAQEMIELPREDRPLVAELVEVYCIGSAGAVSDWEVLGTVPTAGFDEAGNLYLLDSPARVVVVNPGGNFLGQIGRPGEGPGEFRKPEAAGCLAERANRRHRPRPLCLSDLRRRRRVRTNGGG